MDRRTPPFFTCRIVSTKSSQATSQTASGAPAEAIRALAGCRLQLRASPQAAATPGFPSPCPRLGRKDGAWAVTEGRGMGIGSVDGPCTSSQYSPRAVDAGNPNTKLKNNLTRRWRACARKFRCSAFPGGCSPKGLQFVALHHACIAFPGCCSPKGLGTPRCMHG